MAGTPHVDAVVEEPFPSVSNMGADRDLDLVPTSRYLFEL
jgi:hypothetical protein